MIFNLFITSLFFIDTIILLTTSYNENKFCFICAAISALCLLPNTMYFLIKIFKNFKENK